MQKKQQVVSNSQNIMATILKSIPKEANVTRIDYEGPRIALYTKTPKFLMENNKILKIKKNITEYNPKQNLGEFIGLMKLSKSGAKIFIEKFNYLIKFHEGKFHDAPSMKKAYLTDMLQELIDSGIVVEPIIINGKWCEIDTLQDLQLARKKIKDF